MTDFKKWFAARAHNPDKITLEEAFAAGARSQPASSFADAYQGAMEEVAIWKKRALEAEDLNRKFVAEINGPTYMGEQAQPAPSVPIDSIGKLLTQAMDVAVANGANSVSMPDELVEIAAWLSGVQPAPSVPDAMIVAVADLVAQMEIVSRVGFIDMPNDKDSCAAFCVAEGTWLELMSCVEALAVAINSAPKPEGE